MTGRLYRLFRFPLALMNGIAALGGYCLFPAQRDVVTMVISAGGVTLMAMGSAALNQVLERDLDALMSRTCQRPLPQGTMTPSAAVFLGCGTLLAGCLTLLMSGIQLPALLGMATAGWYLAVYTPLKRRTPLALPLGALCGAIPPVIGWCLAGGNPMDFRVIALAGLLFIWQIPHFWLLQRRHLEDYRRAGIPLVGVRPGFFGIWIVALTAAALMLPAFGLVGHQAAYSYVVVFILLLVSALNKSERSLFSYLNLFPVLIALMLLLPR